MKGTSIHFHTTGFSFTTLVFNFIVSLLSNCFTETTPGLVVSFCGTIIQVEWSLVLVLPCRDGWDGTSTAQGRKYWQLKALYHLPEPTKTVH